MIFSNLSWSVFIFIIISSIIIWLLLYYLLKYKIIWKKIEIIFLVISILFLFLSLLEPKWWLDKINKTVYWSNVVFVVDISKSMNALDYNVSRNKISRLDFSKSFITSFISKYSNNNYWLNLFSWETLEVLPLTSDVSLFSTILSWVSSNNIWKNWTDILWAISSSIDFFEWENEWWLIVLISDWHDENNIWDISNLLSKMKSKELSLVVLWVWNTKWSYIPTWTDVFGQSSYKTYKWQRVITKLNEKALKNLSDDLWWKYFSIINLDDLVDINEYILSNFEKQSISSNALERTNYERYFIFISFVFFLLYLFYPFYNNFNLRLWKK